MFVGRCPDCSSVLCLEGKNKTFAKGVQIAVGIIGGSYGLIFILGAIENPSVLDFLVRLFIAFILGVIVIFGLLYIIHWLIVVPFCKNLGYISIFRDEEKRPLVVRLLGIEILLSFPIAALAMTDGAPKIVFYIWLIATLVTMITAVKKYKAIGNSICYLICFITVLTCSLALSFYQRGGNILYLSALMLVLIIASFGTAISLHIRRKEIEESRQQP